MNNSGKITIIGVGDIMLGDGIQRIRRGVRAAWEGKDLTYLLGHLRRYLKDGDVCIGNLECMLGNINSQDPRQMIYKGDPIHLPGLRAIGFTHLSLANNHILEQGIGEAQQTKEAVEHFGIVACCTLNPIRCVIKNINLDIFAYNLIHDTPHLNFYRDRVTNDDLNAIRRSNAQVKVVCIHWGDEYSQYPSPQQIEVAHRMVEHGATLVLGHHPHVVQGIEQYRGAVIAYSLGNFVFDMDWSERTRSSLILKVEISHGKVLSFNKITVQLDNSYIPRVVNPAQGSEMLDRKVLFYHKNAQQYQRYRKKNLNLSRLQAILHLCGRFYDVDRKTWQVLIGKRLRKLHIRWPLNDSFNN